MIVKKTFAAIGAIIALGYVLLVVWSELRMFDYVLQLQADQLAGLPF